MCRAGHKGVNGPWVMDAKLDFSHIKEFYTASQVCKILTQFCQQRMLTVTLRHDLSQVLRNLMKTEKYP